MWWHIQFWSLVVSQEGYGAGLNMTRSMGDLEAHRDTGLIADPEVTEHQATVTVVTSR